MSFGYVFTGIIIAYAIYYVVLFVYDLRKMSKEDVGKSEEEEVDIDGIASEVIKTQMIKQDSYSDYVPYTKDEEVEGKIESVGIMSSREIENIIKNPDDPSNPFAPEKIACLF